MPDLYEMYEVLQRRYRREAKPPPQRKQAFDKFFKTGVSDSRNIMAWSDMSGDILYMLAKSTEPFSDWYIAFMIKDGILTLNPEKVSRLRAYIRRKASELRLEYREDNLNMPAEEVVEVAFWDFNNREEVDDNDLVNKTTVAESRGSPEEVDEVPRNPQRIIMETPRGVVGTVWNVDFYNDEGEI